MRETSFMGFDLLVEEAYKPREDTQLLIQNLEVNQEDRVLDIGTGCGIIALYTAVKCKKVVGVDKNVKAIEIARKNAKMNEVDNVEFKVSDLFGNVSGKFDLITFNPPYLPVENENDRWSGGKTGREVIKKFVNRAGNHLKESGKIFIVISSLTNFKEVKKLFEKDEFFVKVKTRKKIPWEELIVLKIMR